MAMTNVSGALAKTVRSGVSPIATDHINSTNDIGPVGSYFLKGGCDARVILGKGDQACPIAHIAATLLGRGQQQRLQSILGAIRQEGLRADLLLIGWDEILNLEARHFFLFGRSERFLEIGVRDPTTD